MDWNKLLIHSGHSMDAFFDELRHRLKGRTGFMEGVQVLPYRSYGTAKTFYIKGRVLKDRGSREVMVTDGTWRNIAATYQRFNSIEIPHARVRVQYGNSSVETEADQEGYLAFSMDVETQMFSPEPWQEISFTLIKPESASGISHSAKGYVLVPPDGAKFGIISDIDDTVMITEARRVFKMFASTFFKNAHTRLPFPGVAALYRALQAGTDAQSVLNPIFYVSSGPWNLYDLLRDFFEANQIPVGPICLQDFGFDKEKFLKSSHLAHKERTIKHILQMYPSLPFILIGDSGQKDPEIYLKILGEVSNRIKAIYIRDVADKTRTAQIQTLFEAAKRHGGELVIVKDTYEAAQHAAEQGWISKEALTHVRKEMNLPEDPVINELAQEAVATLSKDSPKSS